MPFLIVQQTPRALGGFNNSVTATFPAPLTAANAVIVVAQASFSYGSPNNVTGLTASGYTSILQDGSSSGGAILYQLGVAGGGTTVTVTPTTNSTPTPNDTGLSVVAYEVSGLTGFIASASLPSGLGVRNVSLASAPAAGSFCVSMYIPDGGQSLNTITLPSGWTRLERTATGDGYGDSAYSTAQQSCAWPDAMSSGGASAIIAAFSSPAGANDVARNPVRDTMRSGSGLLAIKLRPAPRAVPAFAQFNTFTSSGALNSDAATVSGSATHLVLHATSGALVAGSATVSGAAQHPHTTSGALTAQSATVSGSATHLTLHTTTGALSAGSATVTGSAAHQHATTGVLTAQAATVSGSAAHTTAAPSHATTGALSADAATVSGAAAHFTLHTTSGALSAGSATVSGAALHPHTTSGALQAQSATLAGSATHLVLHQTSGALVAQAATMSGVAARFRTFTASGALQAQAATVSGAAVHTAAGTFIATGNLQAQPATMSGEAQVVSAGPSPIFGGSGSWFDRHPLKKKRKAKPEPIEAPAVEPVAPVVETNMADAMRKARIKAAEQAAQELDAAIESISAAEIERIKRIQREQEEDEDDIELILSLL